MNSRGFASVALLLLMPLLLTGFAVLAGTFLVLTAEGKIRHQCRVELLKSQKRVSDLLRELMDLNPEAARLRRWEKRSLAGPQAARGWVVRQQIALALRQKSLIQRARLESALGPARASRATRELYLQATLSTENAPSRVRAAWKSRRKGGAFELNASPNDSLTPDYHPVARFSDKQVMTLNWEIGLSEILPDWLEPLTGATPLKLKGECAATLIQEGENWVPKLSADKY
jgi:hypothetical protein